MVKQFPRDCGVDCEHFRCWDLSIDDLTCVCDILKVQVDLCDCDFVRYKCPLGKEKDSSFNYNKMQKEDYNE